MQLYQKNKGLLESVFALAVLFLLFAIYLQ